MLDMMMGAYAGRGDYNTNVVKSGVGVRDLRAMSYLVQDTISGQ